MVYAFKKETNQYSKFGDLVWKNMGNLRNGWEQIPESVYNQRAGKPAAAQPAKPVKTGSTYADLIDQAKGLEKDGETRLAIDKYEAALKIKETKGVVNKITKLKDQLGYETLLSQGKEAVEREDYEAAIDFFTEAAEIDNTKEVNSLIEDTQLKL